jgi:hypothetical protein
MLQLDQDLVASVLAKHDPGLSVLLAPPPAEMALRCHHPSWNRCWSGSMHVPRVVGPGLTSMKPPCLLDSADLICMSVLPEMIGLRNIRMMSEQLRGATIRTTRSG